MHAFKNLPVCPNCQQCLNFKLPPDEVGRKYQKRKPRSNRPHILSCGHNLCEECLSSALKCQSAIFCPVCRVETILTGEGEEAISKIPLDLYTSGLIVVNSLNFPQKISIMPKLIPANNSQTNLPALQGSDVSCEECGSAVAIWKCRQCSSNFCNTCFAKVHKISKILSKHEAVSITQESTCRMIRTCDEHNLPLEFYCNEDSTFVCSYCLIIGSHKNHSNMTLREKNSCYIAEISSLTEKVQRILKNLKKAEKILNTLNQEPCMNSTDIIKNIHMIFQQLHGILQIRENNLINEVSDLLNIHNSPVEKIKAEVSNSLRHVKVLLKDAELALETPEKLDVQHLIKKMENACNISCHLFITDQAEVNDIQFDYNKDILNAINCIGSIRSTSQTKFQLLNSNELPADYEESDDDEDGSVTSDNTSSSKLSTSEIESLTDPQFSISSLNVNASQSNIRLLKQELVFVTHIVNPNLFMVQRLDQTNNLVSLSKNINKWCEDSNDKLCKARFLDSVNKGDLVLAQYTKDNVWYRGRIINIKEVNSEGDEDEILVEISYIDYGNSEFLPLTRIRAMEEQFIQLPESAIKCSLYDIAPKIKDWPVEAIQMMRMFTSDKPVQMRIYEEIAGILQVDLHKPPALNLNINDTPTSVREALVFLDFAVFISCENSDVDGIKMCYQQHYLAPLSPKHNKSLNVVASYVVSPHEFYVQQIDDWNSLSSLMFSIQEKYNADAKNNLWTIFCPQLKMPCVAQYSHDKQWYRAEVQELPGGSKIKVKYVDFGNEELVQWSALKKIADEYLKLPIQAIPCRLVDVEPFDRHKWSVKACRAFNDMLINKTLKIHIKGQFKDGFNVLLYEINQSKYISINTLLVNKGYAKSTGPNSTLLKFSNELTENTLESNAIQTSQDKPRKILSPLRPKPVSVKKLNYPEMVTVKVTTIASPDCLYVQLIGENEEDLNHLMLEIHHIYEQSEFKPKSWQKDQFVAAKSQRDRKWYRAKILQIQENESVEIIQLDYGRIEKVPFYNLRTLLHRFRTNHVFAICCCLVGIQPAGGTSTWTKIACENLQEIINAHEKFFMAKKGSLKEGRLSIDLYIEVFESGGALEPHISSFQSVTDLLIEKGVALRCRRSSIPSVDEKSDTSRSAHDASESSLEVSEQSQLITIDDLSQSIVNILKDEAIKENENKNMQKIDDSFEEEDFSLLLAKNVSCQLKQNPQISYGCDGSPVQNICESDAIEHNKGTAVSKKVDPFALDSDYDYDNDFEDFDGNEDEDCEMLGRLPIVEPSLNKQVNTKKVSSETESTICSTTDNSIKEEQKSCSVSSKSPANSILKLPSVPRQNVLWKKSEMPKETVFYGVVTYVDYDCCFYLHDESAKPTLDLIKATLNNKYQNSEAEAHDLYWLADEPCIAEYHVDQCWYRAQVRNVTDKGIEVIFIDYGNTEMVDILKIRKKLVCTGLPRQSLKCMLHGVEPIADDSQWPEPVLEYLHKSLVDKKVKVILKEAPMKEPLQVSIILSEDEGTLEDMLISVELAKRASVPQTVLSPVDYSFENHQDENMEFEPYHACILPGLGEKINVTITNIEFPSIIWIQRKSVDEPVNKQQSTINEECESFLKLCRRINTEVDNWPRIASPKIGDSVCSKYEIDQQWYRALILNVTPRGYQVLYVDYGNQALVSKDKIRELPIEFLEIPMQATCCQIHQLAPTNGQWTQKVFGELESVIMENQDNVICCIKELSYPVKVDLFKNCMDSCLPELIYQQLVDKGIMTLVREATPEEML